MYSVLSDHILNHFLKILVFFCPLANGDLSLGNFGGQSRSSFVVVGGEETNLFPLPKILRVSSAVSEGASPRRVSEPCEPTDNVFIRRCLFLHFWNLLVQAKDGRRLEFEGRFSTLETGMTEQPLYIPPLH